MIEYADVVCGLAWGDEAKGKITSQLASSGEYDFVCRWAGGNNAGHTVYVNGEKLKTHLIPSGVFYGIESIIGPGCVIDVENFFREINYLKKRGFDTSLVKVSPKAHVVTSEHLALDKESSYKKLGTTARVLALVILTRQRGQVLELKRLKILNLLSGMKNYKERFCVRVLKVSGLT